MRIVAIVPAAGRSVRFGGPKLVADVDGVPLLDRTLAALLGVPAIDRVIVVMAPDATVAGLARLLDPRVTTAINPDSSPGMLSSIQVGVAAAVEADILMLLPADMPFVAPSSVARVAEEAMRVPDAIVVPTHDGRRGHPIAFPAHLRALILQARPEMTLKDVLAASGARREEVEIDDAGILRDVDVPGRSRPACLGESRGSYLAHAERGTTPRRTGRTRWTRRTRRTGRTRRTRRTRRTGWTRRTRRT